MIAESVLVPLQKGVERDARRWCKRWAGEGDEASGHKEVGGGRQEDDKASE